MPNDRALDDCLRLRGGVAPDEHTNRAVREVLSDLAAARREVETVTEEAERQAGVICNLNTALATSRAALEDVRRVEAWLLDWAGEDRRTVRYGAGEYEALDYDGEYIAGAQSLSALGRALAQEAGDA